MKRIGELTSLENGRMTVTFCHMEHCSDCHGCEGGQSSATLDLSAKGFPGVHTGDFAEVEMPTGNVVKASFLVYFLPIAAFMLGLFLGYTLFPDAQSLAGAFLGILGLALSLLYVHLGEKKRAQSPQWHPTLVRVIPHDLHDTPVASQS